MKASPSRRLRLPEGTAIEETARQAARLEAAAPGLGARGHLHPDRRRHRRRTGVRRRTRRAGLRPAPAAGPGRHSAPAEFADQLRARVPDLAAGALAIDLAGQSEFGSLIGREGRLLRVEVGAPDRGEAARVGPTAPAPCSAAIPGLTDVRDAYAGTQPVIELGLERERIALRGSRWTRWPSALAGGLGGVEASELRETDRRTPIRVRYAGARQRGPRHGARGDHRRACPWVSW